MRELDGSSSKPTDTVPLSEDAQSELNETLRHCLQAVITSGLNTKIQAAIANYLNTALVLKRAPADWVHWEEEFEEGLRSIVNEFGGDYSETDTAQYFAISDLVERDISNLVRGFLDRLQLPHSQKK